MSMFAGTVGTVASFYSVMRSSVLVRETTMKKYVLGGIVLLAIAGPALAEEYYVVQDTTTKKCTIVEKKPTSTTMVVVGGDGTVYKTKTEAEAGMKTVKVCSSM
jgi:hypothetical protein